MWPESHLRECVDKGIGQLFFGEIHFAQLIEQNCHLPAQQSKPPNRLAIQEYLPGPVDIGLSFRKVPDKYDRDFWCTEQALQYYRIPNHYFIGWIEVPTFTAACGTRSISPPALHPYQ
ncbi:hypothetical protein D3C79_861500 [compost metagenome]